MRIYLTDDSGNISKGSEAILNWFRIGGCKACTLTVSDGTSKPGEGANESGEMMVWYMDLCSEHSDTLIYFMTSEDE